MKINKYSLIVCFLCISAFISTGAPPPPPPPPAVGPSCWPPPCVPIDGGITLLMAAGAAYGAKKFHDSRKKTKNID